MSNPLHHKDPKAQERPPIPLPDPDQVRHTFDVAMAKVKERRGFYLALAVILLLVAVGAIFLLNLGPGEPPSEFIGLWKHARAVRARLQVDQSARAELADFEAYLETARGTPVEGDALWLLGIYYYREAWTPDKATSEDRAHSLRKAVDYLGQLENRRFDEKLIVKPSWFSTSAVGPAAALLKQVREDLAWVESNAYTEPPPDPSTVAVLRTSMGDVHIQFFRELSPEHVKNFITLARKGTYNETLFHFARRARGAEPVAVQGGDPFSFFYNDPMNRKHVLRWGQGGVGYELPPEPGRHRITHRAGVVTSNMRAGADWDNGAQFMIMTGLDVELDKVHTPFGKVVEGLGAVEKIAKRMPAGEHPTFKDDPAFATVETRDLIVEPATLHKVIVYENGKAMEHDFPLDESEKTLGTLSQGPVKPLAGDAAYCGRKMRAADADGDVRLGLDIPFPHDVDLKTANPLGERVSPK